MTHAYARLLLLRLQVEDPEFMIYHPEILAAQDRQRAAEQPMMAQMLREAA